MRTVAPQLALLVVALLAGASGVGADSARPGNTFATVERTLYLTGEAADSGGLALAAEPGAAGQQTFLAPGIDLLGLVQTPNTQTWTSEFSWDKDLEAVDDAAAILYFTANPQGLAVFTVRLYDVAPDGTANLVGEDEQQFVTALSSTPVTFQLSTAGLVVHKDHVLRLETFVQTVNAAVVLEYGGDTPSALTHFITRWLDSDGDGLADSDEVALGRNPLDPSERASEFVDGDGDGLDDRVEEGLGTDRDVADTDGDGWTDGLEVHAGSNPLDAGSVPFDEDQDGLPDNFEYTYFYNTTYGAADDPDGDGCDNACEGGHGTDPTNPDSDGDGVPDGEEIEDGTDPANYSSYDGPSGVPEPVATAAAFAIGSTLCLVPLIRRP